MNKSCVVITAATGDERNWPQDTFVIPHRAFRGSRQLRMPLMVDATSNRQNSRAGLGELPARLLPESPWQEPSPARRGHRGRVREGLQKIRLHLTINHSLLSSSRQQGLKAPTESGSVTRPWGLGRAALQRGRHGAGSNGKAFLLPLAFRPDLEKKIRARWAVTFLRSP